MYVIVTAKTFCILNVHKNVYHFRPVKIPFSEFCQISRSLIDVREKSIGQHYFQQYFIGKGPTPMQIGDFFNHYYSATFKKSYIYKSFTTPN